MVASADLIAMASRDLSDPSWDAWRRTTYPQLQLIDAIRLERELRQALQALPLRPGDRVLDLGCGAGAISRYFLAEGASHVAGIDHDPQILAFAEQLPPPPRGSLTFHLQDARQPLPFAAGTFDLVWFGDVWLPEALPEALRVLRPGGRLVVKQSARLPWLLFAWDSWLQARVTAALEAAYAATFGPPAQSILGQLRRAAPERSLRVFSVLAERTNPVPFPDELFLTQTFARFQGPLLRSQLSAEDWAQVAQAFDPTSEAYLFRRDDAHFAFAITLYCLETA
jgi:SAM-dependent methyltransferase